MVVYSPLPFHSLTSHRTCNSTLYSVFTTSAQIAFDIDPPLTLVCLDMFCDAFFLSDLYVLLRTAVVLDNKFIKDLKAIRHYQYRSSLFYVDVVSSIPTGMLPLLGLPTAWRAVRILKILRLGRVARIFREITPDKFTSSDIQRLLVLVFYLLMVTHILGCAYILINRLNDWPPHFFVPGLDHNDFWETYTRSLCWALMALTGIGPILTPITVDENVFVLIVIIMGVFVYAVILGNVYSTLANYQYLEAAFQRKVGSVLQFCKYRNVPEDMTKKIVMYYRLMWSRNKGIQEDLLLQDLTKPLRRQILLHSYGKILTKIKVLKGSSDTHKALLCEFLTSEIYLPNDVILMAGESAVSIYFFVRGAADIFSEVDGNSLKVGELRDGAVYGIYHVINDSLHSATLKARSFVEVAVLRASDFESLHQVIPELQDMVELHGEEGGKSPKSGGGGIYTLERMLTKERVNIKKQAQRRDSISRVVNLLKNVITTTMKPKNTEEEMEEQLRHAVESGSDVLLFGDEDDDEQGGRSRRQSRVEG